jgi:hypothetical protein
MNMKAMLISLVLLLSLQTQARTWGSVEYQNERFAMTRVTLEVLPKGRPYAQLKVSDRVRGEYAVGLSALQFRKITAWLRSQYLHEQTLRNRRHEKVTACAPRAGSLKIEPKLFAIDLCRGVSRHFALSLKTSAFMEKFLTSRAVASTH